MMISTTVQRVAMLALALALVLTDLGCASSGLGEGPRTDVTARMATIGQPVATCYEQALTRNRKLHGTMVVAFDTEPGSGKFKDVKIARNDLPDPELEACVKEQVAGLALAQPTKTKIGVEYPLNFTSIE
jgi:hypothetical protein